MTYVATYLLTDDDPQPLLDAVGRPPDHDALFFDDVREMAWRCSDLDAVDLFCALSLLSSVTECGHSVDACRDRFLALMDVLQARSTLH